MIRIERLLDELGALEQPKELESSDIRLEDAAAAAARGDYPQAARVAEEVYASGIFDTRLLGYLLYAALLERGPSALELLLRVGLKAVSDNRLAFTPARRRDVLLDGALHWFLSNALRQLDLSERLRNGTQRAWEAAAEQRLLDGALAIGEQLMPLVESLTPRARTPVPLRRLCDRIVGLQRQCEEHRAQLREAPALQAPQAISTSAAPASALANAAEPLPESPPESSPESSPGSLPEPLPEASSQPPPPPIKPPPDLPSSVAAWPGFVTPTTLHASPALVQLVRKMQRFSLLVDRRDYLHAAVVAADILRALDRFDPRVYLPLLVAPFLRTLADCSDELEPILQQRDSLRFQSLSQLFLADPDGYDESGGTHGADDER